MVLCKVETKLTLYQSDETPFLIVEIIFCVYINVFIFLSRVYCRKYNFSHDYIVILLLFAVLQKTSLTKAVYPLTCIYGADAIRFRINGVEIFVNKGIIYLVLWEELGGAEWGFGVGKAGNDPWDAIVCIASLLVLYAYTLTLVVRVTETATWTW